ncbi:hypothetical protein H2248_008187 [Termitomyces sp. 'cryptogamus']|nr:hypothetical protein H2248_008187 [Termitomyces sp. 'cryptogamus']
MTHDKEFKMIKQVIHGQGQQCGAIMTQLAIFRSKAETDNVKLPKCIGKPINIWNLEPVGEVYALLIDYCQCLWPDLNLVPEFSPVLGMSFVASQVARLVPYIQKDGICYGCTYNKHTQADSLASKSTPNEDDP